MTTLLIDVVIVFWLLLFGGMALLPVITGTTSSRQRGSQPAAEDRVISIRPAWSDGARSSTAHPPVLPDATRHDRTAA